MQFVIHSVLQRPPLWIFIDHFPSSLNDPSWQWMITALFTADGAILLLSILLDLVLADEFKTPRGGVQN